MKGRGIGLVNLLVMTSLALTTVFAVASSAVAHLTLTTKREQGVHARQAAESALAQALIRVQRGDSLGTVTVQHEGAVSIVTVEPEVARRLNIPCSTDNHSMPSSVDGAADRRVPGQCLHLIATGRAGDTTRSVESLVRMGDLPFVIGSHAAVRSSGGLLVASTTAAELPTALDEASLLPGHLVSNGSIDQGADTHVTADVRSAAAVRLNACSIAVDGEVLPEHARTALPTIDVEALDPGDQAVSISDAPGDLRLEGFARSRTSLTVEGDLVLSNAVLYVDGDLRICGSLHGNGALLVRGSLAAEGGVHMVASERVALVASGDVTLREGDFRGLVVTGGKLVASLVTMAGVFVSNGQGAVGMDLSSATVLGRPGAARLRLDVALSPAAGGNRDAVVKMVPMDIDGVPGFGPPHRRRRGSSSSLATAWTGRRGTRRASPFPSASTRHPAAAPSISMCRIP